MIYIFCGTGGVGKTTLSCSFALNMSLTKKTVLLTVDPSERLKSLLDIQYSSDSLRVSKSHPNLLAFSFQKKNTFDRLVKGQSHDLFEKISKSPLYSVMVDSLPKLHEYMAIQEISDLLTLHQPEVFVIDTPPGSHFVDFLSASQKILNFFNDRNEKILKIISGERFSFMSFAIKKTMTMFEHLVGGAFVENLLTFLESLNQLKDKVKIDHETLQKIFKDKKQSQIFLVTSSEEVLSSNIELLMQEVKAYSIDKVIINRDWSKVPTSTFHQLQDKIVAKQNKVFSGRSLTFVRDYPHPPQTLTELEKIGKDLAINL